MFYHDKSFYCDFSMAVYLHDIPENSRSNHRFRSPVFLIIRITYSNPVFVVKSTIIVGRAVFYTNPSVIYVRVLICKIIEPQPTFNYVI